MRSCVLVFFKVTMAFIKVFFFCFFFTPNQSGGGEENQYTAS